MAANGSQELPGEVTGNVDVPVTRESLAHNQVQNQNPPVVTTSVMNPIHHPLVQPFTQALPGGSGSGFQMPMFGQGVPPWWSPWQQQQQPWQLPGGVIDPNAANMNMQMWMPFAQWATPQPPAVPAIPPTPQVHLGSAGIMQRSGHPTTSDTGRSRGRQTTRVSPPRARGVGSPQRTSSPSSLGSRSRSRSRSRSPLSPNQSRSHVDAVSLDDSSFERFSEEHGRKRGEHKEEDKDSATMRRVRLLVREIQGPELCVGPQPSKSPHVRSAAQAELGSSSKEEEQETDGSRALPLAPVVAQAWEAMEAKLRPSDSVNLEQRLESSGAHDVPLLKPGHKALGKGRYFSLGHPKVREFKRGYYKVHDAPFSLEHAERDPHVSLLMKEKKPKAAIPFKQLEDDEGLLKQALATASYQDWITGSLVRHLREKDALDEQSRMLLQSLGMATGHSAQIVSRVAGNLILHRRDAALEARSKSKPLDQGVAAALRAIPLGSKTLFNEQVAQGLAIDQRLSSLKMKTAEKDAGKGSSYKRKGQGQSSSRDSQGSRYRQNQNRGGRAPRGGRGRGAYQSSFRGTKGAREGK